MKKYTLSDIVKKLVAFSNEAEKVSSGASSNILICAEKIIKNDNNYLSYYDNAICDLKNKNHVLASILEDDRIIIKEAAKQGAEIYWYGSELNKLLDKFLDDLHEKVQSNWQLYNDYINNKSIPAKGEYNSRLTSMFRSYNGWTDQMDKVKEQLVNDMEGIKSSPPVASVPTKKATPVKTISPDKSQVINKDQVLLWAKQNPNEIINMYHELEKIYSEYKEGKKATPLPAPEPLPEISPKPEEKPSFGAYTQNNHSSVRLSEVFIKSDIIKEAGFGDFLGDIKDKFTGKGKSSPMAKFINNFKSDLDGVIKTYQKLFKEQKNKISAYGKTPYGEKMLKTLKQFNDFSNELMHYNSQYQSYVSGNQEKVDAPPPKVKIDEQPEVKNEEIPEATSPAAIKDITTNSPEVKTEEEIPEGIMKPKTTTGPVIAFDPNIEKIPQMKLAIYDTMSVDTFMRDKRTKSYYNNLSKETKKYFAEHKNDNLKTFIEDLLSRMKSNIPSTVKPAFSTRDLVRFSSALDNFGFDKASEDILNIIKLQ